MCISGLTESRLICPCFSDFIAGVTFSSDVVGLLLVVVAGASLGDMRLFGLPMTDARVVAAG